MSEKQNSKRQINNLFEAQAKISALLPTPLPLSLQKSKALFECENGQTEGFILSKDNEEVGFIIPFLGKNNQAYLIPENEFINPQCIIRSSVHAKKNAILLIDPTGFYVSIDIGGVAQTYRLYCTESDYATGITATGKNLITLQYNQSHRLATSSNGQDTQWAFVPLFNKTIEWTVDLSTVPCGLNATFYSGKETIGSAYADACATNPSATEFDLMEANQSSWHTTLHLKDNDCGSAPPIGFGGTINDPKYLFKNPDGSVDNTYGYGSDYTINTEKPFTAKIEQKVNDENVLESLTLTLTQGDKSIEAGFDSSNEEYPGWLQKFGEELNDVTEETGNVLFWSLWTGGLDWLESPPCPNGSSAATDPGFSYTISDMSIV